jgi:alanine racemase
MTSLTPPRNYDPWIEIDLDAVAQNLGAVKEKLNPSSGVIAVVKDNAYGCGAVSVARTLQNEGCAFLAVARMSEARELRNGSISSPVLVLGECRDEDIAWAARSDVSVALNSLDSLRRIAALECPVKFHIKIETGMGRLGIAPGELPEVFRILSGNRLCAVEGVFTHLACADLPDTDSVARQLALFDAAVAKIRAVGFNPAHIHVSNSAAIARFPVPYGYLVRPGIVLYGCNPDPAQDFAIHLAQVASLKAQVVKVTKVPAGTTISYCGTYTTASATTIVTIPVGYAHGYPRMLSNTGTVLIRNRRFRVAGRVTMDYIMADVGPDSDIIAGDEAVVIGRQGSEVITVDEIARKAQTIGYEILCGLSTRIDRYFLQGSRIVEEWHPCQ